MNNTHSTHIVIKDGKYYTGTSFSSNIQDARKYNIKTATMVAVREKGMVY